MQKHSRLLTALALTAILALLSVSSNKQPEPPVLMGNPVVGVAGSSPEDELSVTSSNPGTLEAGSSVAGTPASVQQSSSDGMMQSTPAHAPDQTLNSSSTSSSSVPMPADFQYSMPGSSNVDLSTAKCINC